MRLVVFSIFLFLFFLNFVNASQLSLVSQELNINLKTGEEVCKEFQLNSKDYSGKIGITDSWATENYRDLTKYNINSLDLGIKVNYIKEFEINANSEKEISVCFKSLNSGKFYGAVYFYSKDSKAGIGNWVYLNITGENINELGSITGFSIKDTGETRVKLLICSSLFLMFILISLILVSYRQNKKKNH